jgi:hypothetical protein
MRRSAPSLLRLLTAAALVVGGVRTIDAQEARRECPPPPVDPAVLANHAYAACQVDREARRRGGEPRLDWRPAAGEIDVGTCFEAEFEFVVDTLGAPEVETVTVVASTNGGFEDAAREVIPRLRYEPARKGGTKVRQVVRYRRKTSIRVGIVSAPVPNAAGGVRQSVGRAPAC